MAAAGVSAPARAGVMGVARHQARQDALWTLLLVRNVVPTLELAAALLGWLAFGEMPTGWGLGSAALIVPGCLLLRR